MCKIEIEQFLTNLATTQNQQMRFHEVKGFLENQAFNAILFLYREILNISMENQNIQALRVKERKHILVVLTIDEVKKIISNITGIY